MLLFVIILFIRKTASGERSFEDSEIQVFNSSCVFIPFFIVQE